MTNKSTSNIKAILIRGFGMITLLIAAMTSMWFYMIMGNQSQIENILKEQTERLSIFTMRDAAYQRAIILHRMALLEDEFDRDDENLKLKQKAEEFIKAREAFLSSEKNHPNSKEIQIWENALPDIRKGSRIQASTAELLLNNETEQANEVLLNDVIPTQTRVMSHLTDLLDAQRQKTESEVNKTSKQNRNGLIIIGIIASLSILLGAGIAVTTIRRTTRIEEALDRQKLKAQDADQQKSRFLANMSHEIRTPLTAIIGYSENLAEQQNTMDWKEYVHRIIRNGKHLHQLINDILDLSKIEANQLSTEFIPTETFELVLEVESLMGERAKNKGLDFTLDYHFPIPKTVYSDPTRLKQILINLCGNAIKFTEKGSITLDIAYNKNDETLVFTVKDTGIGMTEEQIKKLFKPFKQADATTTRKFGGTGLGLYISKQLAECLNGKLVLESQPGTGSTFTLTVKGKIPPNTKWIGSKEEAELQDTQTQTETCAPNLRGRILLAEDNPDNQTLISMQIRKTGAEVKVVENGQLAADAALAEHFDLILMDMQMPVMGGIEAIQKLRGNQYKAPIAMLTANALKEDIQESQEAGADDFLTKPIDQKSFYSVLAKYLSPVDETQGHLDKSASEPIPELDDIDDLVDMYVSQLPATCRRIQGLVSTHEWEEVKSEIHQLKGTGGAFGLPEITECCADIEKQIATKDYDSAQQLINQFEESCTNIVEQHSSTSPST